MRPSASLALSMVFTAAALGGCLMPEAKSPATGAVATGEPLHVVDDVKVWTTTQKEKVGETVYKDGSGRTIGTADNYEERTQVHSMKVWYPVQGGAQLADEDFFRIAGDGGALDATEKMRANARRWNRRGKYMILGGAVATIGGFFVPNTIGRSLVITGGTLTMSGGWGLAYWGSRQMEPEVHAVDRSIAERAARSYNDRLGDGQGVAVGKSF
jgi:hypothetical protein